MPRFSPEPGRLFSQYTLEQIVPTDSHTHRSTIQAPRFPDTCFDLYISCKPPAAALLLCSPFFTHLIFICIKFSIFGNTKYVNTSFSYNRFRNGVCWPENKEIRAWNKESCRCTGHSGPSGTRNEAGRAARAAAAVRHRYEHPCPVPSGGTKAPCIRQGAVRAGRRSACVGRLAAGPIDRNL